VIGNDIRSVGFTHLWLSFVVVLLVTQFCKLVIVLIRCYFTLPRSYHFISFFCKMKLCLLFCLSCVLCFKLECGEELMIERSVFLCPLLHSLDESHD